MGIGETLGVRFRNHGANELIEYGIGFIFHR